ncbi:DUF1579 domain-containing protein [Dictyobacter aurantiacus]|uniref:DUF1579 domain-containing protein n=1 Tax=Dictyobacter aurantiacus TaxID=1936993 RepID=A0A401ZMF4_9CHLR|nr:DUF1579 domain-containing protein [Dictyobacter aurantiacus]GCE08045.1 hypothetical protein KDAU_53740 [Dictyobacter aurantiacus]
MSDITDFDFFLHTWDVVNKRKKVNSLYENPEDNQEAEWEEFTGVSGMGTKYCDGRVMVDHYEGMFPSGQVVKGVNVRAYNPETGEWSFIWLDNRQAPDFEPLVGKFENGVGRFDSFITTNDGRRVLVCFQLDQFTENSFRWQQSFSMDDGKTWDVNWIMESTRRQ